MDQDEQKITGRSPKSTFKLDVFNVGKNSMAGKEKLDK